MIILTSHALSGTFHHDVFYEQRVFEDLCASPALHCSWRVSDKRTSNCLLKISRTATVTVTPSSAIADTLLSYITNDLAKIKEAQGLLA